jgi:hypothetical protein
MIKYAIMAGMCLLIGLLIIPLLSCNETTTQANLHTGAPVAAPSGILPASEIMKQQGISSIHFVEYDSVTINGKSTGPFSPSGEYYLDSGHVKAITFPFEGNNKAITVYDISRNIAWNYSSGYLTFLQLQNWLAAYEQEIRIRLGSWLGSNVKYIGRDYFENKLCDIFEDSEGYQEWIWIRYRLPESARKS